MFFSFLYQWFEKQPTTKDFQQNIFPTQQNVARVSIFCNTRKQQNRTFTLDPTEILHTTEKTHNFFGRLSDVFYLTFPSLLSVARTFEKDNKLIAFICPYFMQTKKLISLRVFVYQVAPRSSRYN